MRLSKVKSKSNLGHFLILADFSYTFIYKDKTVDNFFSNCCNKPKYDLLSREQRQYLIKYG